MDFQRAARLSEYEARAYLESLRWPNGPICPHCNANNVARLAGKAHRAGLLKCRDCRKQFSVTVGTIFERSHIPLNKWVMAFHIICASKKGISAKQLERMLCLGSYRSAWHLAHRIRHAMRAEPLRTMLRGTVKADETYIGGRSREGRTGRGSERKTPVVALVERNGKVRAKPVGRVTARNLKQAMDEAVDSTATLMTDEFASYRQIGRRFKGGHHVVRHSDGEYSRGVAHVNTAESFFALLKRGIHGAFHHVGRQHLHRYCDEFSFRWNHRRMTDGKRAEVALTLTPGQRLTYREPKARQNRWGGFPFPPMRVDVNGRVDQPDIEPKLGGGRPLTARRTGQGS
jgi:transposase-like protein